MSIYYGYSQNKHRIAAWINKYAISANHWNPSQSPKKVNEEADQAAPTINATENSLYSESTTPGNWFVRYSHWARVKIRAELKKAGG